ncbi:hypothetical protein OF83DRAFT_1286326 [Amylostereum chailletii]|nr:hypothetical protein OF83DRAFT_1286326 [Amylostereum chailletii]
MEPTTPSHAHAASASKIAVVGIAAQLPSGSYSENDLDYESFWDFLRTKGQAYEDISPAHFSCDSSSVPLSTRRGAFLKNTQKFDNLAFGISGRDAKIMPFAARRLVELAFLAMLDSGIDYRGTRTGCFVAGTSGTQVVDTIDTEGSFANLPSAMANRISYILDISGPSLYLDTACSSSLTALHLAVRAIQSGDCTSALVGACQINRRGLDWINHGQGGVLSPDGTSKPFDADANGFGRGEGGVVIVVKALEKALEDSDHIYSIVLGSAINSTGNPAPLYVPNGTTQQACMQSAYREAGVSLADMDYIELHAPGTPVGDPIEANAVGELFSGSRDVTIGSVKANIGHLESSAFLASLVKACLMFEKATIPPSVNLANRNPEILWDRHRLRTMDAPQVLESRSPSGQSIISISGNGIGGSTGHIVLQGPPPAKLTAVPANPQTHILIIVAGLHPNAVDHIASNILSHQFDAYADLANTAVLLSRRARQLPWRSFAILQPSSDHPTTLSFPPSKLVPRTPPRLAYIFSGQGPQHFEMGRELFARNAVFRSSINEMDEIYQRVCGCSFVATTGLFTDASVSPEVTLSPNGWPVEITLPALAMVQIALFDLLSSLGLCADFMIGHSAGETAILYASGAGSKAMAMEIAIARGRAMTITETLGGGMAALACSAAQAGAIIQRVQEEYGLDEILEISCLNSPTSVAITGSSALLDKAISIATSEGIFAQKIRTMVPGHSSYMMACKSVYCSEMDKIFAHYPGEHKPRVPIYTTCTTDTTVDSFTPDYFWSNAINPVDFTSAVSSALSVPSATTQNTVFVELSPHPALASSLLAHEIPAESIICPMSRPPRASTTPHTESSHLSDALGKLSLLGLNSLDLTGLYGKVGYFNPSWLNHPLVERDIPPPLTHGQAPTFSALGQPHSRGNTNLHPTLVQHAIGGRPIMPATGFIELVLEVGATYLWDIVFTSILPLHPNGRVDFEMGREGVKWSIMSSERDHRVHAQGCMDTQSEKALSTKLDISSIKNRLPPLPVDGIYEDMRAIADFGPSFQRIQTLYGGPCEVLVEVRGLSTDEDREGYLLHPALLDACCHILLHPSISHEHDSNICFLPSSMDSFTLYQHEIGAMQNWFSHITLESWAPALRSYNVDIADASGNMICSLGGFTLQQHILSPESSKIRGYELVWQPVIPGASLPSLPDKFVRPESSDAKMLYTALDALAISSIKTTLECGDLDVGPTIDRERYHDVMTKSRERVVSLPSAEDLELAKSRWPTYFEVTERIERANKAIVKNSSAAVDALYSDDIMTRFYGPVSLYHTTCELAKDTFINALASLRRCGKRFVRVLEVGAGTGSLTSLLLPALEDLCMGTLVEYTITDVSLTLMTQLATESSYKYLIPRPFDLSQSPSSQGFSPEYYDIIVAHQVLHAVPTLETSLTTLHSLLVPGGFLIAVELDGASWASTPGSLWHDWVFGSFSEWFGYADERLHCSVSPADWKRKLGETGFSNVLSSEEDGGGIEFLLTAQKPVPYPDNALDYPDLRSTPLDELVTIQYRAGSEMAMQTSLRTINPQQPATIHIQAITGPDADAALGLISTLSKEFPACRLRLAVFEDEAHIAFHDKYLSRWGHLYEGGENIIQFSLDGSPRVPKVVPHASSLRIGSTDPPDAPDTIGPIPLPSHHIRVAITKLSTRCTPSSVRVWVGRVIENDGQSAFSPGRAVLGISLQGEDRDVVQENHVHELDILPTTFPCHPLAPIIVSLAIGPSRISSPSLATSKLRILLSVSDQNLNDALVICFNSIPGISLATKPSDVSRADVILTDSARIVESPRLCRTLSRNGRLILWDMMLREVMSDDPWTFSDALPSGIKHIGRLPTAATTFLASVWEDVEEAQVCNKSEISKNGSPGPVFKADRAYILLGGIGSFGIHLASWIYENGGRYIVLTSRRGESSLVGSNDQLTLKKLKFLSSRKDLVLRLVECDATNVEETASLVHSIPVAIGGCFLMTLVLHDSLFLNQTEESFRRVWDAKWKAYSVFSSQVPIERLDFFVSFSSVMGLLGSVGQSNYSSVCTRLDAKMAQFPNAFSLVIPAVPDVGYLSHSGIESRKELEKWGMSVQAVCASLKDGISRLQNGNQLSQYIPELDWELVEKSFGLPPSCRHLLPSETKTQRVDDEPATSDASSALNVVMAHLGISAKDFSPDVPLAAYGLDSLGAARLARELRPHVHVTQIQLLGQITWTDIQTRLSPKDTKTPDGRDDEDTVLELSPGEGTPVIILHGITGVVTSILRLRPFFTSPLWAIQVTKATPMDSLASIVAFYHSKIKEKQPHGPYCLATFSASSIIGTSLAFRFEEEDEVVSRLSFIDHFPALWAGLATNWASSSQGLDNVVQTLMGPFIDAVIDMLRRDGPAGVAQAEDLVIARHDPSDPMFNPSSSHAQDMIRAAISLTRLNIQFLLECGDGDINRSLQPLMGWMAGLRTPIALFIATDGIAATLPPHMFGDWGDLGVKCCSQRVDIHTVESGHFQIFAQRIVAEILQAGSSEHSH